MWGKKRRKERERKGERGGEGNESDLIGVGSSRVVEYGRLGPGVSRFGLPAKVAFSFFFPFFSSFLSIFASSSPCPAAFHPTTSGNLPPSTLVLYDTCTSTGTGTVMSNPTRNNRMGWENPAIFIFNKITGS